MHVLYFHQHFTTPSGAGGTRSYEMARALVAAGHKVTMVCGSRLKADTGLTGRFVLGRRSGIVAGFQIIEFKLNYANRLGFLQRTLVFLAFAMRSTALAVFGSYDILFATTTPLTAGIPGIVASILRRKPFVFEVRDLWPELPRAMGVISNPVVLFAMSALEWTSYHCASRCIGLAPGIVEGIRKRGIPQSRIALVPNGADTTLFMPMNGIERCLPGVAAGDFVALFTGAHGQANGLDAVLNAGAELKRRGSREIKLVLIGDGRQKPQLQARVEAEALDMCVFLPYAPKTELPRVLNMVNLGMQILANVPAFYYGTSPNKFFDYISSGLPVLINYPGWLAELVTQERCGIAVPPDSPAAFADALERLAGDPAECTEMGTRSRAVAERLFNRDDLGSRFVQVLEASLSGVSTTSA